MMAEPHLMRDPEQMKGGEVFVELKLAAALRESPRQCSSDARRDRSTFERLLRTSATSKSNRIGRPLNVS
jgi:hypothetical protein